MYKIEFKVKELLEKHELSARQVAIACNIRIATMKMYVDDDIQRINRNDLEMLYTYFRKLDKEFTQDKLIRFRFIP